jgi:hypothetical protein
MKSAVLRYVTPCGSCKNRRFGKTRFLQEPHGVTSQRTAFFTAYFLSTGERPYIERNIRRLKHRHLNSKGNSQASRITEGHTYIDTPQGDLTSLEF